MWVIIHTPPPPPGICGMAILLPRHIMLSMTSIQKKKFKVEVFSFDNAGNSTHIETNIHSSYRDLLV